MNSRTRSRKAVSIGSNQSAKSGPASSASGCRASRFVVGLVMAWSPAQRANAGIERVGQPGDYATPIPTNLATPPLAAGEASLRSRPADARDTGIGRLKEKMGELTMANELLGAKVERLEAGRPLARRRSRR